MAGIPNLTVEGERSQATALILSFLLAIQPWIETSFPGFVPIFHGIVGFVTAMLGLFFAGKVQRLVATKNGG